MKKRSFPERAILVITMLVLTTMVTIQPSSAEINKYGSETQWADYALRFDGLDDYVSIANDGSFDFNYAFTVEAWVKPLSLAGSGNFKAIVQGAFSEPPFSGGGWVMCLDRSDYSAWGLSVCVPLCDAAESASGNLQVGQWQHLAARYDGTNISIYRNGIIVANTPWSGNVTDVNFVLLGIWETSFNGLIDEVRIWNIARTQAQIQADMNQYLSGNESGLVGYWQFNEGSGQTIFDSTSNHNNGRLGSSSSNDSRDPAWVTSDVPIQHNPIVAEARLDIGMPYNANRGCPSPYVGCGGPYHGFYNGVCTDLVMDAYNAGVPFNIQNMLAQDHRNHPGRYRYGTARNAEDMRRYFSYNQSFLSHSQPYQPGDIAFFDLSGYGLTSHVLVISEVDASNRPLKMVDASGVIPGINPSGLAFEHSWSSYYEQRIQGHARLDSISLATTAALTETLQILRVMVNSPSVELSLFDSNGKSVSEVYDENLVANNIETSIPYIPGGSYASLGTQKVITVTQPLSNTNQYFVRVEGQANTTYTLLIETLQDVSVTASQTFTQAIGAGETQNVGITVTAPSGVISFTAQSPTSSPAVNLPSSLFLSGLVGTSAQLTFTISETGGQQAISNASITATDLSTQYGIKILSSQLTITPTNFSVAAGSNQQVSVEVNLANLNPGEYLGSLIFTSQSGSPIMMLLTLQVQYHTLYLPLVIRN